MSLLRSYGVDFSDYDFLKLEDELSIFIDEVKSNNDLCTCTVLRNLAEKIVQTDRHTHFSLVYHLIELALILLAITTTVEREFSAMNIIKIE